MTTCTRLLSASAAILLGAFATFTTTFESHAAPAFTVAITPVASVAAVGSEGVFSVHVAGVDDSYPNLQYDVTGGQISGVVALNGAGAGAAEGEVHVERDTPGTATLTASFGGQVLASGSLRFSEMGAVSVTVAIDAGADAAARTWLFEVTDTSGAVVDRLHVGTSGDQPVGTADSTLLPYGYYGVRQVLGNDTKLACGDGAFYQVTAPTSAETTIQLDGSIATAPFSIHVCGDAPKLSIDIPVDPIQPAAGAGTVGDAYPGETPVNEVRGVPSRGRPAPAEHGHRDCPGIGVTFGFRTHPLRNASPTRTNGRSGRRHRGTRSQKVVTSPTLVRGQPGCAKATRVNSYLALRVIEFTKARLTLESVIVHKG